MMMFNSAALTHAVLKNVADKKVAIVGRYLNLFISMYSCFSWSSYGSSHVNAARHIDGLAGHEPGTL